MPKYVYRAVNNEGRPTRGVVTAANDSDLGARLEEGGLTLVTCREMSQKADRLSAFISRKVKVRDLVQMFLQMEQMQKAGVPLMESLADVRDTTDSPRLRDIMTDVCREVSEGITFSKALANHPATFGPVFVSLISAGEEGGSLINSYGQVIKHLKWTDAMQSKIRKATRYPKVLVVVVIGVIWMMMQYVVPQVAGFLKAVGQELPPVTYALIVTSNFVSAYFMYIFMAMAVLYASVVTGRGMSEKFRYQTDAIALSTPVMGPLIRKIALSQFSQTFSILNTSGLDMLKCLNFAKFTAGNKVIVDALTQVREAVKAGAPLSEALKTSGEFPSLVIRMVKTGESTGNLSRVLEQVAEFYDKDVSKSVDGMIQMIEPVLTVVLGGMILWIAAAVFGPIYDSIGTMGL